MATTRRTGDRKNDLVSILEAFARVLLTLMLGTAASLGFLAVLFAIIAYGFKPGADGFSLLNTALVLVSNLVSALIAYAIGRGMERRNRST